jgi:hypothetical protein
MGILQEDGIVSANREPARAGSAAGRKGDFGKGFKTNEREMV